MNNVAEVEGLAAEGKYLTFALGAESYGAPIGKVREIIRLTEITLVPQMPSYVRGVINLRGKIIPVIDLRMRFGFTNTKTTERTCIVVVQLAGEHGPIISGMIVDAVKDVVNFAATEIDPTPDFGGEQIDCVAGIARHKEMPVTLLSLERVFSSQERLAHA